MKHTTFISNPTNVPATQTHHQKEETHTQIYA